MQEDFINLQITHYCPDTPWLLVGMKSDLRSNDGEARPARSMVEKDEAVQLAKDLSQYITHKVTCYD